MPVGSSVVLSRASMAAMRSSGLVVVLVEGNLSLFAKSFVEAIHHYVQSSVDLILPWANPEQASSIAASIVGCCSHSGCRVSTRERTSARQA